MIKKPGGTYWGGISLRLIGLLGLALFGWAIHSLTLGLLALITGLVILLLMQTRNLIALQEWIDDPIDDRFPSASGIWGHVFLSLTRHLRELQKNRLESESNLLYFKEAVEALPDGVVLLDRHLQMIWCNRRAEEHLGLLRERDRGRVVAQMFRRPGFNEYLNRSERTAPFTFTIETAQGQSERNIALERIDYGTLNTMLVTFDVTDLQRAEAMRRDFVANVSHELRTPLTVVSGFLEHFSDEADISSEQRQRFIQLMHDQSQRMLRLVDDLLTLSRLDADESPQHEEQIDMSELVQKLGTEGESLSGGRHKISIETAQGAKLRGNLHELRSAFSNLISNAIRYTPEGGSIHIAWKRHGLDCAFSVTDTGFGIAPEHLPRLTERFYRVDKGRSRETGGTGLGLAIVKHVLLRHQARLEIQSRLGSGSTFLAVIPGWRCETTPLP